MSKTTPQPERAGAVGSARLLSDLEHRADAAWSAYMAACQKATRDREAIDATVYEARHLWDGLQREMKQAMANKERSQGAENH